MTDIRRGSKALTTREVSTVVSESATVVLLPTGATVTVQSVTADGRVWIRYGLTSFLVAADMLEAI